MDQGRFDYLKWWPLLALGCGIAVCYALGVEDYLSLNRLAENHDRLLAFSGQHLVLALAVYAALYVAVATLSIPGASALTIIGGYIFGWLLSAPVTIVAASLGAVVVFQIVKTSLGQVLAQRAGPNVSRLTAGFSSHAISYLLFLRLVPIVPFFAVNVGAGLARVRLREFVLTTFFGIIPGTFAFSFIGQGLGGAIDAARAAHLACVTKASEAQCPYMLSASALITPQLLWAFLALGLVSLLPLFLQKWRHHEI